MNLGLENVERGHLSLLTLKQEKKTNKISEHFVIRTHLVYSWNDETKARSWSQKCPEAVCRQIG